jgi:hypothetical protein
MACATRGVPRIAIHVRHHQDFMRRSILDDGRDQFVDESGLEHFAHSRTSMP